MISDSDSDVGPLKPSITPPPSPRNQRLRQLFTRYGISASDEEDFKDILSGVSSPTGSSKTQAHRFPANTDLIFPAPGKKMSLTVQNDPVEATLHCALRYVFHTLFFKNPFPVSMARTNLGMKWLINGANDAGYPIVAERAQAEVHAYALPLITVVRNILLRSFSLISYIGSLSNEWSSGIQASL